MAYVPEIKNGEIVSMICWNKFKISVGQIVTSNGRFIPPKGTKGIVQKIHIPFTDGCSTDVFDVLFEWGGRKHVASMKIKDLVIKDLEL